MRLKTGLSGGLLAVFFAVGVLFIPATPGQADEGRVRGIIRERIASRIAEAPAPLATASVEHQLTAPGDYVFHLQHGGLTRMYSVHVPDGYTPARSVPVLFAFHGGGGDMNYMARDEQYGLRDKADRSGFVVVFPNGYSNLPSGKFATWNAGACCGDARDKNIDDVGFVRAMMAHLGKRLNIDHDRVFATGMSNGGLMAYRLACEMADVFSAVAAVAGTDNTLDCHPSRSVSVLHIHARNDTHVLFTGGAGQDSFQERNIKKVTDFTSVADSVARWVGHDRCAATPQRVLDVDGAYCDLYSPCAGGAQVKLCVTESGGHSWPGGKKPGGLHARKKEPTSKAISANDMMWDFFMEVSGGDEGR